MDDWRQINSSTHLNFIEFNLNLVVFTVGIRCIYLLEYIPSLLLGYYSQTCLKRPLTGPKVTGRLKQVAVL